MVEAQQSDRWEPEMRTWTQRCMTTWSGDAKFDYEDQAKGMSFSPRYGNILFPDGAPANIEMGGELFGLDRGKQREPVGQNIGPRSSST